MSVTHHSIRQPPIYKSVYGLLTVDDTGSPRGTAKLDTPYHTIAIYISHRTYLLHTMYPRCTFTYSMHVPCIWLSHPHADSVMGTAGTHRCQMPLHQHTRTTDSPQIGAAVSRPPPRSHGNFPIMHTTLCSRYSHHCCNL